MKGGRSEQKLKEERRERQDPLFICKYIICIYDYQFIIKWREKESEENVRKRSEEREE